VPDLVASKLLRPLARPGSILRSLLVERLARESSRPIVSVVAPAGYGKTTLLSQWAEHNGQAFAWVSVDEKDNDPKVLLSYVAEALDAIEPVDGRVFDALASPVSSVPGSVVPRLGSAFSSMTAPVALVLDDVHVLHDSEGRAALSVLAEHVPGRSRLVLAGRAEPPLRIARLRAEGKILEIGPRDLVAYPGGSVLATGRGRGGARRESGSRTARTDRGMAGRALPGGAVPAGRRLAAGRGGLVRRGRPVHQRVRGVGVPGPDLPGPARVPDPERGTGADVRPAVRGSAGAARLRRGPGRAGPVGCGRC
jgi:hypothetical protein